MTEKTPLLDRAALEQAYTYTPYPGISPLPNVPFRGIDTTIQTNEQERIEPGLTNFEKHLQSVKPNRGPVMGGSITRSLAEVTSGRYDNFVPGDYNNEDAYAQGQNWGERMVNGVGKGLALTGTTFLQSTAGLVNGVVNFAATGRAASFYDNDFNRALDELNKQLEDELPNYYTDVEKNARWYSPKKLITANFFWDGIIKNMGFAAGAALSGAVYAKALAALPLTSRLFSVGKAAETLAATEEALLAAGKTAETYGKVRALSDKFLSSYKVLNPGGRALVAGLATTGEAGFEAYHNLNEFRDQKIAEYKAQNNGAEPIGAALDAINSEADKVGNSSFLLNTALLTATNYIQFPKILGSSYKAEKGVINSLTSEIGDITKDATGQFVKTQAKTKAGRIASAISKIAPYTFSAPEAFEEGAQYAISVGTKDYYDKRYNGETASFLESLLFGVEETLGTDEGMENVLIGGLSGALMSARGRFKQNAEKSQNTAAAIQAFNNWKISDFTKATIDSVNRGTTLQEEREAALRQGDVLTSKDKEMDYIINYLTPRVKYGRYDLVLADINEYKQLASTEEGFAQLQAEGKALLTDTKAAYTQRLENLASTAENIKSLYQSLQLRYGGLRTADNQPLYSPEVMDKMIYAATKVADYDKRIQELSLDLATKGIYPATIIGETLEGKDISYKETLEALNKSNRLDKDEILSEIDDIVDLAAKRDKLFKEYNEIKNSPESFKEAPITPESDITEDKESLVLKTKTGDKAIEVGTEYFLGRVVEYDKSGKEVYRAPKITILGENEDGTIKIKDAQGNIKNVSKAVLADYKLAKVSDTLANKKAKFFMENWNTIFQFNFGKGKTAKGRLEYSSEEGKLLFVYKDSKGKIREIEVTGDQFVPKKGFTKPMIQAVGTLSAVQQQSLEQFSSEKDNRLDAKKAARLSILNSLFEELVESQSKIKKLINQKQKQVDDILDELKDLEESIKNADFDARAKKSLRFKSQTKKALEAAMVLSRTKEQLESEIEALKSEEQEIEINVSYIADLTQNLDELPTDSKEFLEELREQKALLESTLLETGKNINSISKLIDNVQAALDKAVNIVLDNIARFEKKYPEVPRELDQSWIEFLKQNPKLPETFNKEQYKEALKQINDFVAQVEDLDITPNERTLAELREELNTLQKALAETEQELKAKDLILNKFETVAKEYKKQEEEKAKIANDKQLRKEILGTADSGLQTANFEKDYEPESKKTNIGVVTSTKAATSSTLPHHIRANTFGANWNFFKNKDKIKGVLVTSKTEGQLGLKGLTAFLKGTSDVDASKIVALVMVEDGKPVGVDGQILAYPTFDNAIFQVMPDPKLEWSSEFGGGTMFRKETTPEQIEYYKTQYASRIKEVLDSDSIQEYTIMPSFGIPEYVTYLDDKGKEVRDYDAVVSVVDAGLIKESDLVENKVIFVPTTTNAVAKEGVVFNSPLGRPFLELDNGFVKLNNRKLTSKEANTIYKAIHALATEIFTTGSTKTDKTLRLTKWLKSIIYWGIPKNATGYNSVFFTEENDVLKLYISGKNKSYNFTPTSIEDNKAEIIALLEGMYNNVQTGLVNKDTLWTESYEEIVDFTASGEPITKTWPNYQTYLLSGKDRNPKDIPLFVQLKPVKEEETNRKGIYFTIKDDVDRYAAPVTKKVITPAPQPTITTTGKFVLDGKTINTFTSPSGKKILFVATSTEDIKIAKGGDLNEVLASLTAKLGEDKAKENIKIGVRNAVGAQLASEDSNMELTFEDEDTPAEQSKIDKLFGKAPVKTPTPKEIGDDELSVAMDDLEDDEVLRVKIEESIKDFKAENWDKVEKWLKANFPNVPVYRVKQAIRTTNGLQAWGMLKDGAIYVYENAEVGTIYHEVFEAVWKAFTPQEEQQAILSEFKARKGTFVDRPTGKVVNYSEATNQEAKEQLAEEFRDFVLYKKVPAKPASGKPFIVKLFNDLVNLIKTFFTGKNAISNTEALFEKIGTGYYKQYTPTSELAFAKQGLIDIDQVIATNASEFRVALPADVLHDVMQQMTYLTLHDLLKNNKSLFSVPKINKDALYKKLKYEMALTALKSGKAARTLVEKSRVTQAQANNTITKSIDLAKKIRNEWEEIKAKHEEYLKTYSIEFDENDETTLRDENNSGKSDYQDATKIDIFKKANSAVKLLLSTIPMVDNEGKLLYSSVNGVRLLPTSQVFMAIMNNVHTSRNIDEMVERLKVMAEEDNNYKTLYNRLTKKGSDLSTLTETHDIQLLAAFWRTFKTQSPDVKNVYIFENGEVEVGDSNLSSAARQISSEYNNAIIRTVKGKNPYFEFNQKEKVYVGIPKAASQIVFNSDKNRVDFLKSLGIEFKVSELNKLNAVQLKSFREAVSGIVKSIADAKKIATVGRKVLSINGRLMQLSLIRAAIDNPEFDSTYFNVNGERTQSFIGTNPASDLYDYLSQIDNKQELVGTPYEYLLTDSFTKTSIILNKMFNPATGNRVVGTENLMKVGYADGTINLAKGKKKQSAKLTYKERLIQEINLNLAGYYYNLVPGDASMEWMVYMSNHISAESLLSGLGKTKEIFRGYLEAEIALAKENRPVAKKRDSKELRFFKAILGESLQNKAIKGTATPAEIDKAVEDFIQNEVSKLRNTLTKYGIIKEGATGIEVENLSFSRGETITEETLNRNLQALTINFMINNIELHKLLYSDPYQYSDELKRIKNANSPRQPILNSSAKINSALNKAWNQGYEKGEIGYTDFTRDYFKTATLADVISSSDLPDYGTFEETDGGGIISFKAYRVFRIKAGDWNDNEELQYRYDVAFEKQQKGQSLSKAEKDLLAEGNPQIKSAYTPLKPIVFGNKANDKPYNDIDLDKFALYPLSYRVAFELNSDSNAVKQYDKMIVEDIDYVVFNTGRKVGATELNSIYNEDGSFNETGYKGIVNIPHNILAIQSEVPSKDEPVVTRGSQITKLATLDYMEAGVPIDFEPKENWETRFANWALVKDKEVASPLYKEIKNNQKLLEEITLTGYESLLNKLGLVLDSDGNFVIKDFKKAASTLKSEVLKREVNDNILSAFTGFEDGDVILEATPLYQQVRNILYSIADKNVISPKISGGMKVQIPSTLFETVRPTSKNGVFQSDVLGFYQNEDGKRVCEVMLGRWFDSEMSDSELLEYLNNTKEGQKILSGIGYRIPTQKQNSIDVFKIKQFLPKEFGDSVVIPSALVKKVGSDFDIDKLSVYLKNVYTDLKGKPKVIPFVGYGEKAKEKLAQMYEEGAFLSDEARKTINKWVKNRKEEDKGDATKVLATAIFGEEAYEQEVIDDYLEAESSDKLKHLIVEQAYKKSLENAYIESLESLVANPLNFENLIKPNSADQLKALASDVTKKLGKTPFNYADPGNMLSRTFMSSLRQAFVSGKYAIGIAAVNQTNHSLNQRSPIYIDLDRWDKLSKDDKFWLSGGTMNKEDAQIKFKNHNTITVNDKKVSTLSMIKNSKGENISDIIGQFIDGYVDISKGPWIMELGATPNVASTWLFLVKLGVPIKEVAYFMNQPIIKDYLDSIENAGYSWLFIKDFVKNIKNNDKYSVKPQEVAKVKTIPTNLADTVGKQTFTPKERAEQQFILNEFLKYSKMANHMFLLTQGTNFDTASFNDPYLVFKKFKQLEKAKSSLISSPEALMDNSFIGVLSNTIYNIRDAFSTILASDKGNVREVIEKVLTPYIEETDRDFVKIAQKAVNDLFDWAVQTDRQLNNKVTSILLSDDNTAKQINDFISPIKQDSKHPLHKNLVVNLITPHFSGKKEGGVNNLKIKNKDNKVYDQNQMIYAFEELRKYLKGTNSPLYGSLVRLAVLQSGLSNSPISFTSLLPYEDFKEIYNKTLSTLENMPNLADFAELNVFQRNNWNNADLVPHKKAVLKLSKSGEWSYNKNMTLTGYNRVIKAINNNEIPKLVKINQLSRESDADVIVYSWEVGTKAAKAEMRKKGDFSYIKKGLFKKLYKGNEPFTITYSFKNEEGEQVTITDFVYKMINAWGDSHASDGAYFSANEFYTTGRPSVIDNGFIKVEKELSDETIITYFETPVKNTPEDKSNSKIPC